VSTLTSLQIRDEFPITQACTYLDSAYWGPYPRRSAEAISDYVRKRSTTAFPFGRADQDRVFAGEVRSKIAGLLGVAPEEIWFPRGTTDALGTVAAALLAPGDEILVGGLDHPADYAVWANLAERGIRVKVVPQRGGRMNPEDLERAITAKTRAIGICLVNTYNGYRQSLDALSRIAGEHELYLLLDAIQGIGHLRIDLHKSNVTMMSAGSYKWLCSPEGLGVAYINRDVIGNVVPHNVHFYGIEPESGGWASFIPRILEYGTSGLGPQEIPSGTLNYPASAIRLEISPSIVSLVGLNQMADLLNEFGGMGSVEARVISLSMYLRSVAQEHGHSILSTSDPEHMSGITSVLVPSAPGFAEFAKRRNIHIRERPATPIATDAVRVSPHIFNDKSDIDMLVEALNDYRSSHI